MQQPRAMRRLTALDKVTGYDPHTGATAPTGPRFKLVGEGASLPRTLGRDFGRIQEVGESFFEMADMWQPGDPDQGITVRVSDGSLIPRIDHIPCIIPLTDVDGSSLEMTAVDIEAARRDWYARHISTSPRLTPVHHILGASDQSWWGLRGPIQPSASIMREAWLQSFWTPEHMLLLRKTHEATYTLDWGRLPERAILRPLAVAITRAEAGQNMRLLARLNLRKDRAEADMRAISAIGLATSEAAGLRKKRDRAEAMARAQKAYESLAVNKSLYEQKAAALDEMRAT